MSSQRNPVAIGLVWQRPAFGMSISAADAEDTDAASTLRPALDEARHRLAARRRTASAVGIGLVQIERDGEGIGHHMSPSRITGTVLETPPSTSARRESASARSRNRAPCGPATSPSSSNAGCRGARRRRRRDRRARWSLDDHFRGSIIAAISLPANPEGKSMQQHFRMFAAYNKWANGRIYEAASQLSADEFERNTGAFFKSMMGTLNHLVAADRIWMKRFTGEGDAPTTLDAIVSPRFRQAARRCARPRTSASSNGSARSRRRIFPGGSPTRRCPTCARSRSGWRRRSTISSTTRPTIAARRT